MRLTCDPANPNDLAQCVMRACALEVTAPKPGNVHPQARFCDVTYEDFLDAASAIAPIIAQAGVLGVGPTVNVAVAATHAQSRSNINLGIILLLAPLAAVPAEKSLPDGIGDVLANLTRDDAVAVYEAIRLANPGGLGSVPEQDVAAPPTVTLLEAMRLAADRDSIARQYAENFSAVFRIGVSTIAASRNFPREWVHVIVRLALKLMAALPDTLIARKCGNDVAQASARMAAEILACDWPDNALARKKLIEFDAWLREDGNRRNPGTTADLVAASLFAAFRDNRLALPDSPTPDS